MSYIADNQGFHNFAEESPATQERESLVRIQSDHFLHWSQFPIR